MLVAAVSSFSRLYRPLGGGDPASPGETEVHLGAVRDEDGGALPLPFAEPGEERIHQAKVRRGVEGTERLVEEEEPQPGLPAGALDPDHLAGKDDPLPLPFREGGDGTRSHLLPEAGTKPPAHPIPLGRRARSERLVDGRLGGERASRV